jgi:hypothetical protein
MSVYQIAIFANGADSYAAALRATIQRSFSDLGIPSSMLCFLDAASVSTRDRKSPTVGVFFGFTPHPAPAPAALSDLIGDATLVLPVVPSLERFTEFVPTALLPINGMALRPEDPERERRSVLKVRAWGLSTRRNCQRAPEGRAAHRARICLKSAARQLHGKRHPHPSRPVA